MADCTFTQIERNAAADVLGEDIENRPPEHLQQHDSDDGSDNNILAYEEFTPDDPAMQPFYHSLNQPSSDEEEDEEEEETEEQQQQQQHEEYARSSLTQDAAASLLGFMGQQPPMLPPPQPAPAAHHIPNPYARRSTQVTPPNAPGTSAQLPWSANSTLANIASLLENGNAKSLLQQSHGLTTEELSFANNSKRGKNQKSYQDSQESIERRFFDTLQEFGVPTLKNALLRKVTMDYGHGPVDDFSFYKLLSGEKTPQKQKLLGYALMLPALKWTCQKGKRLGEPLEPSSFNKMIQKLFYQFAKKGIQYHYKNDFNEPGGFHGLVIDRWNAIRKTDPHYGTHRNKSTIVNNYLELIVDAIHTGKLQPYSNPQHLQLVVIFIMGYYVGLRGSNEHVDLMMADVIPERQFTLEGDGPQLAGLRYCGVRVPFHKMKQLKLGSTTMSAEQQQYYTIAEDPNNTIFCPWKLVSFYLSRCHPNATKFYAKAMTKSQITKYMEDNNGTIVWYHASDPGKGNYNLGKSTLAQKHKELAKLCGVDEWEKVTGHALRTLIINTMKVAGANPMEIANAVRQKSLNAQMTYNRNMHGSEANKATALRPKAGSKRPATIAPPVPMSPPQKRVATSLPPNAPTSKERLQMEVDTLNAKLAIVSSQQNNHTMMTNPPNQHYASFNPMAMAGMASMMNPMMMNPWMAMQAQAAMFGPPGAFNAGGQQSMPPFQNSMSAFQAQPPIQSVQTEHPTMPQHQHLVQRGHPPNMNAYFQHQQGNWWNNGHP
jgi:hypothetical protein